MGRNSKIEWCHHTFNPWIGCAKVSEGCAHCYAEREFGRKPNWANCWGPGAERKQTSAAYWKQPLVWDARAKEKGVRYRVFCGSLCDVFEDREDLDRMRGGLISLIEYTPHLDWLFLTKRPESISPVMDRLFAIPGLGYTGLDGIGLLPNLWVGVSVENQEQADERIPILLEIPAVVRFVSVEPMLGPIDLELWLPTIDGASGVCLSRECGGCYEGDEPCDEFKAEEISQAKRLDWVICGGESGPKARPMHPDWTRNLCDQCITTDTPFLFKQWGEWQPVDQDDSMVESNIREHVFPDGTISFQVGKKRAGRVLDGRVWDEVPRGKTAA